MNKKKRTYLKRYYNKIVMIILGFVSLLWITSILFYCCNNNKIEDDTEEDAMYDLCEDNDYNDSIKSD